MRISLSRLISDFLSASYFLKVDNGAMPVRKGALARSCPKCSLMLETSTVRETNGIFSSLGNSMAENAMEGKSRPSTAKLGMTLRIYFMRYSLPE